jgi:hypothetical protein
MEEKKQERETTCLDGDGFIGFVELAIIEDKPSGPTNNEGEQHRLK